MRALLLVVLLSACDGPSTTAPPPPAQARRAKQPRRKPSKTKPPQGPPRIVWWGPQCSDWECWGSMRYERDDDPPGDLVLEGQAVDKDGTPLAHAVVALSSQPVRRVETEADG